MTDALKILCDLFASVPDGTDLVGKGGGRIGGVLDPQIQGPLARPLAWLTAYGVKIKQCQDCDLQLGALAQFHVGPPSFVAIPLRAHTQSSTTLWHVWHETGHAADLVQPAGKGRWISPNHYVLAGYPIVHVGLYSAKHLALLKKHEEEIITWNPCDNRDYKTQPVELWAEVVACALCDPLRLHPELIDGIRPDLAALKMITT